MNSIPPVSKGSATPRPAEEPPSEARTESAVAPAAMHDAAMGGNATHAPSPPTTQLKTPQLQDRSARASMLAEVLASVRKDPNAYLEFSATWKANVAVARAVLNNPAASPDLFLAMPAAIRARRDFQRLAKSRGLATNLLHAARPGSRIDRLLGSARPGSAEVVSTLVTNPALILMGPASMRNDVEVMRWVLARSPQLIAFAGPKVRADLSVAAAMVKGSPKGWDYVAPSLRQKLPLDVLADAITRNPDAKHTCDVLQALPVDARWQPALRQGVLEALRKAVKPQQPNTAALPQILHILPAEALENREVLQLARRWVDDHPGLAQDLPRSLYYEPSIVRIWATFGTVQFADEVRFGPHAGDPDTWVAFSEVLERASPAIEKKWTPPLIQELFSLKQHDPEAYAALRAELRDSGIHCFYRFSSVAQLRRILADHKPGANDARPLAIVETTVADWPNAFGHLGDSLQPLLPHYRVIYNEVGSDRGMVDTIAADTASRKAAVLIIAAHGEPTRAFFGEAPGEASTLDVGDTAKLAAIRDRLEPHAVVILESCSTGKGGKGANNLANTLASVFKGATVYAPEAPTRVPHIAVDGKGQITDVVYGDAAEYRTTASAASEPSSP